VTTAEPVRLDYTLPGFGTRCGPVSGPNDVTHDGLPPTSLSLIDVPDSSVVSATWALARQAREIRQ